MSINIPQSPELKKASTSLDSIDRQKFLAELKRIIDVVASEYVPVKTIDTLTSAQKSELQRQGENLEIAWFLYSKKHPSRGWVKEFIYLPPKMFALPKDHARGIAAHEAGHVSVTRYSQFIPKSVYAELGFTSMLSALEERPTDNFVRFNFTGAGEWLNAVRQANIADINCEEMAAAPKFAQFNVLILYGHFLETQPTWASHKVWELYRQVKPVIDKIESTVPKTLNATEQQRVGLAKQRYIDSYCQVWPKVKDLVGTDHENESLKRMLENQINSELSQQDIADAIADGSLAAKIQEILEQMQLAQTPDSSPRSQNQSGASQADAQMAIAGSIEELAKLIAQALQDIQASDIQDAHSPSDPGAIQIPIDQLSPEIQAALKEQLQNLTPDQQQQIKEQATQALQQIEDKITEQLQSKINPENNLPTHEQRQEQELEIQEQEQQARQQEATQAEIAKLMQETSTALAALNQQTKQYDMAYQQVYPHLKELEETLKRILFPNLRDRKQPALYGDTLNLPAVFQRAAAIGGGAKQIDNRIFESINQAGKKNYAITLLVDLSGSMEGQKIREAFKATILLVEVLNKLRIKFEVLGFQDQIIEFKTFQDILTSNTRQKINGMPAEVINSNPGGNNWCYNNDDGPCLRLAAERLQKQSATEKIIFIISDGQPNGRRSNKQDLRDAIASISKTNLKLIGLGIGLDTEHVEDFYGQTALPNIEVSQMSQVLGDLLLDMIQNPHKY